MDPYRILGVDPGAPPEEVHRAYRARARELHPDVSGDEEGMKRLNEAYALVRSGAVPERVVVPPYSAPSPAPAPLPRRRWGRAVALVLVVGLLATAIGVGVTAQGGGNDRERVPIAEPLVGRCVLLGATGIVAFVDCASPHDGRVVDVTHNFFECPPPSRFFRARDPNAEGLCVEDA